MRAIVANHRTVCGPVLVNIVTFLRSNYLYEDVDVSKVFIVMCVKHWER